MRKDTNNDSQNARTDERPDDTVSTLMNLAGPRADIPVDIEKRVHDNVRQHWQDATSRKNTLRWAVPASLAATILIAFVFNMQTPDVRLQPIGTIASVLGGDASAAAGLVVGDTIYAGDELETGPDSGVSVSLAGDVSLRIAAGSSIRLDGRDEITLLHGQLYADSGDRIYRDRHLTVNTFGGSATDIGTQFSVAYTGDRLSVAVREGRVDVANEQSTFTAEAGDSLILQPGTDVVVEKVTPYDSSWDWATSLAPDFDITDRSLLDFLKWAARETGKTLIFSSDDVRMAAMGTHLFGSIKHFTPEEALESVLSTTQFDYDIDERSITIKK
jgi:hypothetical protein